MGKRSADRGLRFKCSVETKIENLVQKKSCNRPRAYLSCIEEQKVALEFASIKLLADYYAFVGVRIADKNGFAAQIATGWSLVDIGYAVLAPDRVGQLIEKFAATPSCRRKSQHPKFVVGRHCAAWVNSGKVGSLRIPNCQALCQLTRAEINHEPARPSGWNTLEKVRNGFILSVNRFIKF